MYDWPVHKSSRMTLDRGSFGIETIEKLAIASEAAPKTKACASATARSGSGYRGRMQRCRIEGFPAPIGTLRFQLGKVEDLRGKIVAQQDLTSCRGRAQNQIEPRGCPQPPGVERHGLDRIAVDGDDPRLGSLDADIHHAGRIEIEEAQPHISARRNLPLKTCCSVDTAHCAESAGARGTAVGREGQERPIRVKAPILGDDHTSSSKGSLSSPVTINTPREASADLARLVAVRMKEEGTGIGRREVVGEVLTRLDRLLGHDIERRPWR